MPDTSVVSKTNPIEGIAAPKQVADAFGFVDGPQWFKDTLYVSRPFDHLLLKVKFSDGAGRGWCARRRRHHRHHRKLGRQEQQPDQRRAEEDLAHPGDGGPVTEIASMYNDGDGGTFPFDTPNDLVQHPSGTIIFTDPGYENPAVATNHLIRVLPDGGAFLLEDFPDAPRPTASRSRRTARSFTSA